MKTVHGRLRFLLTDEGGRLTSPKSGVRSQLRLGEVLTSVVVRNASGDSEFVLGIEYPVQIDIQFWEQYGHLFDAQQPLELYEGSKLVAQGKFD